ncbi:uncharacterized protein CXorf49 homolog [Phocoena sinus]|uniref:uncharacterized protein CXorf49 homolog n=1 Tax=Phocoena sinus TaxID=42100 RepID=UPI0013C440BA|nr:uncharacterized protein CXorf49 homolog [Phocoena sinus]
MNGKEQKEARRDRDRDSGHRPSPRFRGRPGRDMSSPDEVSVWRRRVRPKGRERAGVRAAGPAVPRGPDPDPKPGEPRSGEGGGRFLDPKGFQSKREMLEARGPVLWGREGGPGSPDDHARDLLDLIEESEEAEVANLQQLTDQDVLGVRRYPDPEGFESEPEMLEVRGPVLWGREGGPGSPDDHARDLLDLIEESEGAEEANLQQLTDQDALGVRRYPTPESSTAFEESTGLTLSFEEVPGGRGEPGQSCGEAPTAPASPLHLSGPEAGRALGNPKRGTKRRLNVAADRQRRSAEGLTWLLSDSESSDEFSETQLMTVSTYPRGGGHAKPSRPEDPGDTPRHSKFQARENFLHVTGSSLSSAPRGLSSVVERQGVGEQGISSPKKMQSVLWGKGGSKPSYPGAAAAAAASASASAAAAGGLPRVTPRKNGAQEKKSVGGACKLALGGTFRSRGQRISATPVEPATFPPISGIPQPGRPKSYTLLLSGTKQSKHSGAGKKSVVSWAKESEAVSGEDKDTNRDPAPKGQLLTHRPGTSCLRMHRRKASSGDVNTRSPQDPGNSEPLALNRGEVMPRGPAPSGDREPLDHPPRPETQQQPLGTPCCPWCLELKREVDELKEQLAAMQYLADKSQTL